ncbi:hypothetical protein [Hyalangium versicolor]|uniref:hypothetical protein n=1 Tax=Hyalangium versicolor TaxID=2861190 RepID=UPI001CD01522|nr:hypothetical protein [Hyalangium versicolor]
MKIFNTLMMAVLVALASACGVAEEPGQSEPQQERAESSACAGARNEAEARACFEAFLAQKAQESTSVKGADTCQYCSNDYQACLVYSWSCGGFYAFCAALCCQNFNNCSAGNCGGCF